MIGLLRPTSLVFLCAVFYLVPTVESEAELGVFAGRTPSIAFWKTHKTGGTTLFSILNRYARAHNQTVATCGEDHVATVRLSE
ncbi:unnamed protein product, partial [Phaeothamnion confervicola]